MRFYDSDFDYAQEIIDNWNNGRKRMRTFYFILAALLILAGIATAAFPAGIFAVIQYLAAIAVIVVGIWHFVTYSSTTYYFKDSMHIISGILNILIGIMWIFLRNFGMSSSNCWKRWAVIDRSSPFVHRLLFQRSNFLDTLKLWRK